jgi:hypothetical protein
MHASRDVHARGPFCERNDAEEMLTRSCMRLARDIWEMEAAVQAEVAEELPDQPPAPTSRTTSDAAPSVASRATRASGVGNRMRLSSCVWST